MRAKQRQETLKRKDIEMGLFGKKKEAKEQKPIEEVMAQNVFGKTLLPGEKIDYCIQGKGQAEKLVFSTAVLAVTEKGAYILSRT